MIAEDLKKKIDEAKKIVRKLGLEEPYNSEAFGAILTLSLMKEKIKEGLKERPEHIEIGPKGDSIKKLAKDANITIDQLRQIFDFEEEDLTLLTEIIGKNEEERQFKATLLMLTGLSYCYGREEILSPDLKERLARLDIRSLTNLSANLRKYRQYILLKGRPGDPRARYKITGPGKRKGLGMILELIASSTRPKTEGV